MRYMIEAIETIPKELEALVTEGFRQHALGATGADGDIRPFVFVAIDEDGDRVGLVSGKIFWGCLHIKNLFVLPQARGQGLATRMVEDVLAFGHRQRCSFAAVETLSFQARDFYLRLGFEVEFERRGYDHGVHFIYLRKNLL